MNHFRSMHINVPADSTIRLDERNNTVILLQGKNLSEDMKEDKVFAELLSKKSYPQIALAFLSAHHTLFKLQEPSNELQTKSISTDDLGYTHIRFQQIFKGVPILNAEINVHLNRLNQVNLINGRYVPTPSGLNTQPSIPGDQAIGCVAENFSDDASHSYKYTPELIIYAPADQTARLAYQVSVHSDIIAGSTFIVDAGTGTVLTRFSTVYH